MSETSAMIEHTEFRHIQISAWITGQSNMNDWGIRRGGTDAAGNTWREDIPWDPGFNAYRTVNGQTRRIRGKSLIHNGRKPRR